MIPGNGIDPSWHLGLEWAEKLGLQWGKDIIFTYGPLYFISLQSAMIFQDSSTILSHAILIDALLILAVTPIAYDLLRCKACSSLNYLLAVVGFMILFFYPTHLDYALVSTLIYCFARIIYSPADESRWNILLVLLDAFIISALSLAKLSFIPLAIVLLLFQTIFFFAFKKQWMALWNLCAIPFFFTLLWVGSGQSVSNIGAYFSTAFQLSAGYSEAMLLVNPANQVTHTYFMVLSMILLGSFSLWLFTQRRLKMAVVILTTLPVLFLAYKNGAVRDDLHFYAYYSQLLCLLPPLILAAFFEFKSITRPVAALILFPNIVALSVIGLSFLMPRSNLPITLERFGAHKETFIRREKDDLKVPPYILSPAILKEMGEESVDIFPVDISVPYAYNLNWRPRPIFQSYTIHHPELDVINSVHFQSGNSPQWILYKFDSIDDRYPLFDEPLVFQTLLKNYRVARSESDYLLLANRDAPLNPSQEIVTQGRAEFEQKISVPKNLDAPLFLYLDLKLSPLGRLFDVFYRTSPLYIHFHLKDGNVEKRRIVRALGVHGFYISCYVSDVEGIREVFENNCERVIEKVSISGDAQFYAPDFSYEFRAFDD